MFDLNQAILQWRQQMAEGGIKSREVLNELESHLRDDIEELMRSGREVQTAFHLAVVHLGTASALQKQFARSLAPRKGSRRKLLRGSCFVSAFFVVLINSWTLIEFDLRIWQRLIGFAVVLLAAAYLAVLPFLHRLISRAAYARFLGAIKILSLGTLVLPILAILTASQIIHVEFGILPLLVVWLLYIAISLTLFAVLFGEDHGLHGGSSGSISPSSGPLPIPPGQFGQVAQQSLEIARQEAARLGHHFVGTEHVLLGVLKLAGDPVRTLLRKSNVDCETVQKEIEHLVVAQTSHALAGALALTPRAKKAFRLARKAARNQPVVKAEHILLGLLLEGTGVAALALKNVGLQLGRIRQEISRGCPYP